MTRGVTRLPRRLGGSVAMLWCVATSACNECTGTASCHGSGEVSYSGQFIERRSGAAVSHVRVEFLRKSGVEFASGTPTAVSDEDGFFVLRAPALQGGVSTGDLLVQPPAPFAPFTMPDVTLEVNYVRGDGGNFGRIVVNPYLFLVGHVRDAITKVPQPNAQVIFRRVGGGRANVDSMSFVTDAGGQFGWEPELVDPNSIDATFEITAPGYPHPYLLRRNLGLSYRDLGMTFVILEIGDSVAASAASR